MALKAKRAIGGYKPPMQYSPDLDLLSHINLPASCQAVIGKSGAMRRQCRTSYSSLVVTICRSRAASANPEVACFFTDTLAWDAIGPRIVAQPFFNLAGIQSEFLQRIAVRMPLERL